MLLLRHLCILNKDKALQTPLCMRVSRSVMSGSLRSHVLYVTHQASLSTEFSRQEYWSVLPFPYTGDLPNPGTEPRFPALQTDFFNQLNQQESPVV